VPANPIPGRRDARRRQILDAVRASVARHGLGAVTLKTIIDESGLATGTIYQHFRSKDEMITAAVLDSLTELAPLLAATVDRDPPPAPADALGELLATLAGFAVRDGVDVLRLAVHGWSAAQSSPELGAASAEAYGWFRARLAGLAERWRTAGMVSPGADPATLAELLLSLLLGYTAQRALIGSVSPAAHAHALAALAPATPSPQ
jgi:AcrR family transcriptional regulator